MKHTCADCGQEYAVVLSALKAHPGYQSPAETIPVPASDAFGDRPGTVARRSSHWVPQGPSLTLEREDRRDAIAYTWTCPCDATQAVQAPRLYVVPCQHRAGGTGMCGVAHLRENPPSDLYTNPRYGASCACCGHQGTHTVLQGQAPACGAAVA